jgi:hypothetical protein
LLGDELAPQTLVQTGIEDILRDQLGLAAIGSAGNNIGGQRIADAGKLVEFSRRCGIDVDERIRGV